MNWVELFKEGKKDSVRIQRSYDDETNVSTVSVSDLELGISVESYSKPHPDDVDFMTKAVGIQIAEMKAVIKYTELRLTIGLGVLASNKDRQVQKVVGKEVENLKGILKLTKEDFKNFVQEKDAMFKKIKANREKGGYKQTMFEDLGDLLKDLSPEDKQKIFADAFGLEATIKNKGDKK